MSSLDKQTNELAPVHEETTRRGRLRPSLKNGEELRTRAIELHKKAQELQSSPEDDPERIRAELDFEEANLDLKIFDFQHDPTGALKRDMVGEDLAEQLAEHIVPVAETPTLVSPENITPVFLVNMGELDRLNKKYDEFGNEALTRLANIISQRLVDGLEAGDAEPIYKIYRADNNSFMVRFLRPIPRALAKNLSERLAIAAGPRWEAPVKPGEKDTDMFEGVMEAPPVIVDYVSIEDVMQHMRMDPELSTSESVERYAVSALKDVLFSRQEVSKIVSRFERIRDIEDDAKAKELYDFYLKKSLSGIFSEAKGSSGEAEPIVDFQPFRDYAKSLGEPKEARHTVEAVAYGKVLADLGERYKDKIDYLKQLQGYVAQLVKDEKQLIVQAKGPAKEKDGKKIADKPRLDFVAPDPKKATEGLQAISLLGTEVARKREDLQAAEQQVGVTPAEEIEKRKQIVRIAEKRLTLENIRRDSATGLEWRGPMFKKLETAMEDPSKRVGVVSMDMGFLKYFDQVGGRDTGNLAILKVAEVFQQIKDAFSKDGIEVSVHRLGGDEFGMSVVGESSVSPEEFRKKIRELKDMVEDAVEEAGHIPAVGGPKEGYFESKLSVGVGAHIFEDGAAADAEDEKYGLTEKVPDGYEVGSAAHAAWKRNVRTEHLLKVASKVMEYSKASDRLLMLAEKLKDVQELEGGSPEDRLRAEEHLKQLANFSDKAMFGDEGRLRLGILSPEKKEKMKRELPESRLNPVSWAEQMKGKVDPAELEDQIAEFVEDAMKAKLDKEVREHGELAAFSSFIIQVEYYKGRVLDLGSRLKEEQETTKNQREYYEHKQRELGEKLKEAEESLNRVRALRSGLPG